MKQPQILRVLLVGRHAHGTRTIGALIADEDISVPPFDRIEFVRSETLEEALAALRDPPPQLIFTDLALPDSQGLETFQRLHAEANETPIVVLSEFEDDEHFSSLESFVCQQGTKECLLPAELQPAEQTKLHELMELCEVPSTSAARGAFATKDAEQDLQRLLGTPELHGRCFESSQKLALGATCGLVKYLQLMASTESHGQWAVEWVDAAHHVST